jgi:hypothetical protein
MNDTRQGVSLFDVCTMRMRRNLVVSIVAKMRRKLLQTAINRHLSPDDNT